MKLITLRPVLFIFLLLLSGHSFAQETESALVAHYPLDGNPGEVRYDSLKGRSIGTKPETDRNGEPGKAISFLHTKENGRGNITLPVNVSSEKLPVTTICFWIRPTETYLKMMPLYSGEGKTRGVLTASINGAQRWSAAAGKDGLIAGPPVLKDQWTFIAVIYDAPNEQARFIVNNEVFGGRARLTKSASDITIGSFNGMMDELMIFNRALTLPELEKLYGGIIDINISDFKINDRSAYRERMEKNRRTKVRTGDRFIVGYGELIIRDSIHSPNVMHVFSEGDTVTALTTLKDEWFEVSDQHGKRGFISGHTLEAQCYRTGNNKTIFRFVNWLGQIFQIHRIGNWLVVALFTVILVMAVKGRFRLNAWFSRIGNRDSREAYGSKSEGTPVKKRLQVLEKYFPVERPSWWMISPGLIFGLMLIGGSFWDTREMEWYFNEGFSLIPSGYTLPIHWTLWMFTLVVFMLMAALVAESLTIAGPKAGILRIIMLFLLNFMAIVVAFYLSVGLILAVIGFILFFLAVIALLGRRRY